MTKNLTWSLLLVLTIIAITIILWHKWPWLRGKEQTKEGFDLDLCFTVDSQSGETVFGPCPKSKEQPVPVTPEEASFSSGVSASSALGDNSLASSTVTGFGTRDTNEGVGDLTGSGGGALWEQRRGEAAGGSNISSEMGGNFCEDDEFTVGSACCPKDKLPPGAVYDTNATTCEDWSCPRGFVKGAGGMQCVVAGRMSVAVIKGTSPSLDTKGILPDTAIGEKDITVRVNSGEPSQLGQTEVILKNEESGKQITKPGSKKSDMVFDFGPFDLETLGSGQIEVLVPFSAIAPRAKTSKSMTFFYCNPENHYMSLEGDKQCLPRDSCTGFLAPAEGESYSKCQPYTECEGAPLKYAKDTVVDGVKLEDNVCCPPKQKDGFIYDATGENATDPLCNQTCSTGPITRRGCLSEAPSNDTECKPGQSKSNLVQGKRYFDSTNDQWVVTEGGSGGACVNCSNALPPNAEWGENCETNCMSGFFKTAQGGCQQYTVLANSENCPIGPNDTLKRVRKISSSGNYVCCDPLLPNQVWTTDSPAESEVDKLGRGFTTDCSKKCEDGYYENGGSCIEYGVNTSQCDTFTVGRDTQQYIRGRREGGFNYTCCTKGPNEKWAVSDEDAIADPRNRYDKVTDLFTQNNINSGAIVIVDRGANSTNSICKLDCESGFYNAGNTDVPDCNPYSGGGIESCPKWNENGDPKLYRTQQGSKTKDVKCCDKPNNSQWLYTPSNTTGTYPVAFNSNDGKPVAFYNQRPGFTPCNYKCDQGYYKDEKNDECLMALSSETCQDQIASGGGEERENPIRAYDNIPYTSTNMFQGVSKKLSCCPPLGPGETWYNSYSGGEFEFERDTYYGVLGRERNVCTKVGFHECNGKFLDAGYAKENEYFEGLTLAEMKEKCRKEKSCGGFMIYSATKPSDNSETLLTGYKLMNNPTDSRYFIGCNCSYINLDNGGNSTLWHTYFKQANYTDRMKLYNERQGCSL